MQPTPIFDPTQSSSFSKLPCSSNLCKALTDSNCNDGCGYLYGYGDHSTTQGVMASETFTFDQVSVPNIGFGCGNDNQGIGLDQSAGLVGLGRGPLSIVSQLHTGKYSYCLTSLGDSKTGSVLFGSLASSVNTNGVPVTTPLIKNPSPYKQSFYYLSLEGITVGTTRLPIPKSTFAIKDDGSGGVIIDSGATVAHLEDTAFKLVTKAFKEQINLPVAEGNPTELDLCFSLPSGTSDISVPPLLFHFNGADLDLPRENYMFPDPDRGLMCLAMRGSSNGMSIIGNFQQQNTLVLHDLDKQTLSFTATKCDQL
ncbi:hypothetical protein AQUCO_03900106v1 [Aquilegia coerulea]|uniref:Peptidase A1 domain-containing protein n=1 Tax=Aquilegia coerulea TaxID=218851 RepID=A0A2G5CRR5_AQUCA|nr:hypothetical protein AQUCO_03900106v1 [Aquilegia coerulea]